MEWKETEPLSELQRSYKLWMAEWRAVQDENGYLESGYWTKYQKIGSPTKVLKNKPKKVSQGK